MEINRNNYERYFIDYLDGRLSDEQVRDLSRFMHHNPDLKEEIKGLETIKLNPDQTIFSGKPKIRKSVFSLMHQYKMSYDELCVACLEGDLPHEDSRLLLAHINENSERTRGFELLGKAVLIPDRKLLYPRKSSLKRLRVKMNRALPLLAAAAALIVLFFLLFNPDDDPGRESISDGQPSKVSPGFEEITLQEAPSVHVSETGPRSIPAIDARDPANTPPGIKWQPERIHITKVNAISISQVHTDYLFGDLQPLWPDRVPARTDGGFAAPAEFLSEELRKAFTGDQAASGGRELTFWDVAEAGIKKLDELSAQDYLMNCSYDALGNLQRLTLETPVLGFYATLGRKNSQE